MRIFFLLNPFLSLIGQEK